MMKAFGLVALSAILVLCSCSRGELGGSGRTFNAVAFGAKGNGETDDTQPLQRAIDAAIAASGGTVYLPPGIYLIKGLKIRGNNVTIRGAGNNITLIRQVAQTRAENVVEFGVFADGNAAEATHGNALIGVSLDGNKGAVPRPSNDLAGWGVGIVRSSFFVLEDVRVMNCWLGGVAITIESNFGRADVIVENCGLGDVQTPSVGFDVNSSCYGRFRVVARHCYNGVRLLDNCWGNSFEVIIEHAEVNGFIYKNQTVNISHSNVITATVIGGCKAQAMSVGANCRNSIVTLVASEVKGLGLHEQHLPGELQPRGNTYLVNTRKSGAQAVLIGGTHGVWTLISDQDGRQGERGAVFAADVYGTHNQLKLNIRDEVIWKVRGVAFRASAHNNHVMSFISENIADAVYDIGNGNTGF